MYLCVSVFILLYILSIPVFSRNLSALIEPDSVFDVKSLENSEVKAIVVLGCNRYSNAPEFYGSDTVSSCTLVRLRYAAMLGRETGLPIIVSGGQVYNETKAEAELMQDVLEDEFETKVLSAEKNSKNTLENAKHVSRFLERENIQQVVLVTHAMHMLRSEYAFKKHNIEIIPAPTYFYSTKDNKPFYFDFLPSMEAFYICSMTFHEIIGYIWLRFKYLI